MDKFRVFTMFLLSGIFLQIPGHAMETAKTVPKGRGGLLLRNLFTETNSKTNRYGQTLPLAEPMTLNLTYERIVAAEKDELKRKLLTSFLREENIDLQNDLGRYTADFRTRLHILVPVLVRGITDRLTLMVAAPFFDVSTAASVGFIPNVGANKKFLATMMTSEYNRQGQAFEGAAKINGATAEFHKKLEDNGYAELNQWNRRGFGDTTLGLRYGLINERHLLFTVGGGVVLPTGKTDDPDHLGDIPFGDGQTDLFLSLALDQPIVGGVFFNQHFQYTRQTTDKKTIRLITALEQVDVEKDQVTFKLGDKVDAEISLQWEATFGLKAGIGMNYFKKWSDRYQAPKEVRLEVEKESDQESLIGELKLGYSTLPAVLRGDFTIPFGIGVGYRKEYSSRHRPKMDILTADFDMFF